MQYIKYTLKDIFVFVIYLFQLKKIFPLTAYSFFNIAQLISIYLKLLLQRNNFFFFCALHPNLKIHFNSADIFAITKVISFRIYYLLNLQFFT